jgi:predicted TIM-barrel fold metal-dependent hydrolase
MPKDIGVVDLMLNIPGADNSAWYDFMKPLLLDEESRNVFEMPAQYMFTDIPQAGEQADYVAHTIAEMEKYGIDRAMVGVSDNSPGNLEALARFPERFFGSYHANPNLGMEEVRNITRAHAEHGIKAVTGFPSGVCPQVPINDKKWYPIYAKCVELDLPFACCVGVPGPRLPMAPQHVELIDEVCWFFPELKFVMRHGAEPWTELAVKLMLKYPNLYYMTSAFAPKHYPKAIIDYANTRGGDKIMYAGYYPMGLSLERIFGELPEVPFRDEVWPKFLRENAIRVFGLDAAPAGTAPAGTAPAGTGPAGTGPAGTGPAKDETP